MVSDPREVDGKAPPLRRGFFFPVLALVLLAAGAALAAEAWKRIPWHLADIWWTLDDAVEFREFSIEVEIAGAVGGEVPLYIAPTGLLTINGIRAYGGLQTQVHQMGREAARGIIFSRWDERREDHIRAAPGGVGVSSGSEGDFVSVRNRMDWREGRYRVILTREAADAESSWLRYRVCALPADACAEAGSLKFPGASTRLGRSFNSFFEVYGKEIAPDQVPRATVVFRDPQVDGKPVRLKQASAFYPGDVPPRAKASGAGAAAVRVESGPIHDRAGLAATPKGVRYERLQLVSH
ncbi:MAG: hypothetical protein H7841_05995 [Magnetospirillum sp. WYHS-4]